MSPRSLYDATEQPPAHTGMKEQSPQSLYGASASKRPAAAACRGSCRPFTCPTDWLRSPAKPGDAKGAPAGAVGEAGFRLVLQGALWAPAGGGKPPCRGS